MSAWTAPATFASGAVLTAAQLNTEVRDHAIWTKSALDLITASTAADTGDATYVSISRAAVAQTYFVGKVTGDTGPRIRLSSTAAGNGAIYFDDGTAALGSEDTYIYRDAAVGLETPNLFTSRRPNATDAAVRVMVSGDTVPRWRVDANGRMVWGAGGGTAADVSLYRDSANVLKTEDSISSELGFLCNDLAVVQERKTGWGNPTGTATRTTFATTTVSTEELAERVHALLDDLIAHGLIGA